MEPADAVEHLGADVDAQTRTRECLSPATPARQDIFDGEILLQEQAAGGAFDEHDVWKSRREMAARGGENAAFTHLGADDVSQPVVLGNAGDLE